MPLPPSTASTIDMQALHSAERALRELLPEAKPQIVLVLGSGWGGVASACQSRQVVDYGNIPGLGSTGVVGHAGKLLWGTLQGKEVFVFQGRRHFYEGLGWTPIATPLFLAKSFGASTVILTSATGSIEQSWQAGDLMVVEDHINMMGTHPLIGPHHPELGPRFFDVSTIYSRPLREALQSTAKRLKYTLRQGVLAAMPGPTYESPAEVRMLKTLGASAVGMSLVPEALIAHGLGLSVLGLSCLTNLAAGISTTPLTHEEVTETMQSSMAGIKALIEQFFADLA